MKEAPDGAVQSQFTKGSAVHSVNSVVHRLCIKKV